MSRPVRLLLAVVITGAWLAVMNASADAHALLRSSQPSNGATLGTSPPDVLCIFTEPPDPRLSSLHVLDTNGHSVEKGHAVAAAGKKNSLQVNLPPSLPTGTYTVAWRTVSKVDGHVAGGSFAFGVGVTPTTTGVQPARVSSTPGPGSLAVGGRWLFLIGLIVLFGGAATGLVVYGRQLPPRPGALLWGGLALTVLGLAGMFVAEHHSIGTTWSGLFRSTPGRYLIAQAISVLLTGLTVVVAHRWWRRWWALAALAIASGATLFVHVMSGHANTPGSGRLGHLAAQELHVVAVATWIGGLAWLLWYLRRSAPEDRPGPVRRFSTTATVAVLVVAVSGVFRAWNEVDSVRQLWTTDFGRVLDVKLGLFAVLLALGGVNRFWLVPALARRRSRADTLRWTVTAEVAVALPVLLAASVLSQLSPASYATTTKAQQPDQIVVRGADYGTTTRAALTVSPGTPGPNSFALRLTDYDTGEPVTATSVQLRFTLPAQPGVGGSAVTLTKLSDGLWRGNGTPLSLSGQWSVIVVVQQTTGSVTIPMTVQTRSAEQRIEVQRAAGEPDLYTITLADGSVMQTYIDPGTPGQNAVHATFFKPSGDEESISTVRFNAISPTGRRSSPSPFRFDKGHFDVNIVLSAGRWNFEIAGITPDHRTLGGHFDQNIAPRG